MYKMSKKSLLIRVSILPVYMVLWVIGLIILIGNIIFDKLWDEVDYLRDIFQSWVDKIAPLD